MVVDVVDEDGLVVVALSNALTVVAAESETLAGITIG